MAGIGIITNPYSKLNKRNPVRPLLLGYILGEQGQLEVTESLDALQQVAERFRDSDIKVLAINGGDGTVARTLTAFIRAYGDQPLPKIALLRGGTMNVLASNLGVRGSPESLLYRYLEAHSASTPLKLVGVQTLEVEGNYGFLFADGVAYAVLEEFYQNKTGPVGAALLVLRLCVSALQKGPLFRRLILSQKLELAPRPNDTIELESCAVMASTIEKMPLGPRLFPLARKQPGRFQFFAVKSKPEELIWHLPAIMLKNGEGSSPGKISYCCEELAITSDLYDKKYMYSLDGELFTAASNSITVRLGPKIEFVIP